MTNKSKESQAESNLILDDVVFKKGKKWVYSLVLIATILMVSIYTFNFHDAKASQETFAQFGDFFGGVLNPFLSFLAVILLLISIRIQATELSETRKEIRETKDIHSENLKLAEKNIKSQEDLFFLQVAIDEMQIVTKRLNESFLIISKRKYTPRYGNIPPKVYSLPSLENIDKETLHILSTDELISFTNDYYEALQEIQLCLRRTQLYLYEVVNRNINSALFPTNNCQEVLVESRAILHRSDGIIEHLHNAMVQEHKFTAMPLESLRNYIDITNKILESTEASFSKLLV